MSGITPSILLTVAVLLIVRYFRSIVAYMRLWRAMETIGGLKCHWLAGNTFLKRNEEEFFYNINSMDEFPRYKRYWLGNFLGGISIHDPKIITNIIHQHQDKSIIYNTFKKIFGDGLVTLGGVKWKHYRKLLSPSFHNDMMRFYMNIFNKASERFIETLKLKEEFNVKEECLRVTLEIITEAIYGENSLTENERVKYLAATNNLSHIFIECAKNPLLFGEWIFSKTKHKKSFDKCQDIFTHHGLRSIKLHREKTSPSESKGMLNILINATNEKQLPITDEEIIAHLKTFMIAGHETTASALSFSLYLLACHHEHQERCRKEIFEIMKDKQKISWKDISKLSYVTMCIKETLRLFPPAFMIARKLSKETDLDVLLGDHKGVKLPEGASLTFDISCLHRNPLVWENASSYDPMRFTQENFANRPENSFIPFSTGKRNCIGQNFAMTELKVVLSLLLKSFKFTLHEDFREPKLDFYVTLQQNKHFKLRVEPL